MQYREGDKEWVFYPIRRKGLSESLMHRWIGPYVVLKKLRDTTYRLLRCSNNSTTTAHVVRMKPYYKGEDERSQCKMTVESQGGGVRENGQQRPNISPTAKNSRAHPMPRNDRSSSSPRTEEIDSYIREVPTQEEEEEEYKDPL